MRNLHELKQARRILPVHGWRERGLVIALALVFTIVFGTRMFYERFGSTPGFQQDSEGFVTGKVSSNLTIREDFLLKGGFLYRAADQPPYTSQVGLQGFVISLLPKLTGLPARVANGLFRGLFSLLLALLLAGYGYVVGRQFGWITAALVAFYIVASYWIVSFGKNLYWAIFLHFAPLLVSWLVYPQVARGKLKERYFYGLMALLVFLKALNGYEFITNVILGATVPVVYYEALAQPEFRLAFRRTARIVAWTTLAGIGGFLAAVALHSLQLLWFFGNIAPLLDRLSVRTFGEQYSTCEPSFFRMVWEYLRIAHWINPLSIVLPLPRIVGGFYIQLIAYVIVTSVYASRRWFAAPRWSAAPMNVASSLNLAAAWALLCSLSWVVLARNHMSCHYHMNSVIFYLPFGLTFAAQAGYLVEQLVRGRRE